MAIASDRSFRPRWNPLAGIDWGRVRQAYGTFVQDPAVGVGHIIEAARNSRWQAWVEARLAKQAPELATRSIEIDLAALSLLPIDTLGGAYAWHLEANRLDPEKFVTPRDRHWVQLRMAYGHDIGHVITGFDSTPVGEFGLAAFCLQQQWDLLNIFVLSFAPWTCVGYPHWTGKLWASIWQGFRMAQRSKLLFAYPFEENWEKPLAQVRRELGITRMAA